MDSFMKIMDSKEIERILKHLCRKFLSKNENLDKLIVIGIQRRGAILAERISKIIGDSKKKVIPVGTLDINLYRDDLSRISYQPVLRNTSIPFSIHDK
ncbi:bifunctional pyr operon transcriptional regulator/uracil phosphoribosyltransferase, partial [Candidatus Aerophobetes bacterium]